MRSNGYNGNNRSERLRGAELTAALLGVLLMGAVGAASGQTVSIVPVAGSTVDCGGNVDYDVIVSGVNDLRGYSLYVQYDDTIVTSGTVTAGPDFAAACGVSLFPYAPVAGLLRVDAILQGCSLDASTDKSVLRISFAPGAIKSSSTLTITGTSILRDSGNNTISVSTVDGSISNICNTAPVIAPQTFGVDENSANGTAVGTVLASDIDTVRPDVVSFAITAGNGAGGFAIDGGTGVITVADVAVLDFETTPTFALTVEATDDDPITPKSSSATITINLNDVNEAPVLGAIGEQLVDEEVELAFQVLANDVDAGAALTFSLNQAAIDAGMTIDGSSGAFSWTPTEAQGPATYQATVTVSDGALSDAETFDIVVNEVNLAPVVAAIGNQLVAEETTLTFTATATDDDIPVQGLTFSLNQAAIDAGMTIDGISGVFSWTPTEAQGPNTYTITITVTDGELFDAVTFDIAVSEVNAAPVVSDIPDQTIDEGQSFLTINLDDYVADPDHADNQLSWAAAGNSELLVEISLARVATIAPPNVNWNGSETITFTATDPGMLTGANDATFTVTGVNDAPTVTIPADQTNTVLDSPALQIVASDDDGDGLTYSATGLPLGLVIGSTSGTITGTIDCGAVTTSVQVTVTDSTEPTVISFTWTINPIDPPAVLAGLTAAQVLSGNDSDGTTKINLTWTVPTVGTGATILIYRKPYGDYPLYNGAVPVVPTVPGDEGWTLVADDVDIGLGAYTDEPTTRNFWYYTAVVANSCSGQSVPSALTGGTLNYHLGDVTDGNTAGNGDNIVEGADIGALGFSYATVPTVANNYLDIGPTTDYNVRSRPVPDNLLDFEDLILMAINFGAVSKSLGGPEPADRNELMVFVPEEVTSDRKLIVSLWLSADGSLKGTSIPLTWNADAVKPIGFERGSLVAAQDGQGMLLSPAPGTVDFALFGTTDGGISGEGLLATVTFEVLKDGDAGIGIGAVKARDLENKSLDLDASVTFGSPASLDVPMVSVLHQNFPNPFNPTTTFKYGVAVEGRVSIEVYDVRGRLVSTLLDEVVRPGSYEVIWDGSDDGGRRAASGVYLARFKAVDKTQMQRVTLLK